MCIFYWVQGVRGGGWLGGWTIHFNTGSPSKLDFEISWKKYFTFMRKLVITFKEDHDTYKFFEFWKLILLLRKNTKDSIFSKCISKSPPAIYFLYWPLPYENLDNCCIDHTTSSISWLYFVITTSSITLIQVETTNSISSIYVVVTTTSPTLVHWLAPPAPYIRDVCSNHHQLRAAAPGPHCLWWLQPSLAALVIAIPIYYNFPEKKSLSFWHYTWVFINFELVMISKTDNKSKSKQLIFVNTINKKSY